MTLPSDAVRAGTVQTDAVEGLIADITDRGIGLGIDKDSLVISGHREALTDEMRTALVAAKPALLAWFRGQERPTERIHAPSRGQSGLHHLNARNPDSPAYTVLFAAAIRSAPDLAALDAALDELVRRHHALRSEVFELGDRLLIRVL
ncbi:hypothetical protein, partial [Azospirillum sp. B506]|uniref:TubC N-terminal docking domain-related protein n=1 Tax=Azospirillum sp. B506 TaxID=137721 RepID=UPI0005B2CB5B